VEALRGAVPEHAPVVRWVYVCVLRILV
jgi:hypothetical protein